MTFETTQGNLIFIKDDMIREIMISRFRSGKSDYKDIVFDLDEDRRREYTVSSDCAKEIFDRLKCREAFEAL
jgi:hypothetical protein